MQSKFFSFLLVFCASFFVVNAQNNALQGSPQKAQKILKALSWNVYLLPGMFNASRQKHRAERIGERLAREDYDVLLLQEVFGRKSRKKLHEKLQSVYPYFTGPANKKGSPFKTSSGVMIYSRYPLSDICEIRFNDCKGIDCWGRKGAVFASLEKEGQEYQVMSTHLQSASGTKRDYIRLIQYYQLYRDLILPNEKKGIPQILGGDYNTLKTDSFFYDEMLRVLDAEDGDFTGDTLTTYDSETNDLVYVSPYSEVLDYVLIRGNGKMPGKIERRVRAFKCDWDRKRRKKRSKARRDLSDHYAVEFTIKN